MPKKRKVGLTPEQRRQIVKQAADRVMPGIAAVLGADAAIEKARSLTFAEKCERQSPVAFIGVESFLAAVKDADKASAKLAKAFDKKRSDRVDWKSAYGQSQSDLIKLEGKHKTLLAAVKRYVWIKENGDMGATDAEETQDAWKALKAFAK